MSDASARLRSLMVSSEFESLGDCDLDELIGVLLEDDDCLREYMDDMLMRVSLSWVCSGRHQSDSHFESEMFDLEGAGGEHLQDANADAAQAGVWEYVVDQALAERRKHELEDRANKLLIAQQAEEAFHKRFDGQRVATAPSNRVIVIPKSLVWLSLAALVLIAVWIGAVSDFGQSSIATVDQGNNRGQASPSISAVSVQNSVSARWHGALPGGSVSLAIGKSAVLYEGLVELSFQDGASVVVEAPASFTPMGPNSMRLDSGRVVATVPESAHGFTVLTDAGLVTDLGTEFGVEILPGGNLRSQVFEGLVTLAPAQRNEGAAEPSVINLHEGDAAIVDRSGEVREIDSIEHVFVRAEEFAAHVDAGHSAYARWMVSNYELRRDPALVAMYLFDDDGVDRDRLVNIAPLTDGVLGGTLTGADRNPSWVTGRWSQSRALAFDSDRRQRVVIEDWVDHAPGSALTLSVWFRADPDREDWNIVVSQWREDVGPDCRFHLGVVGRDSEGTAVPGDRRVCLHVSSIENTFFNKDQLSSGGALGHDSEWINAVFTISAFGEARLYINGEEVDHDDAAGDLPSLGDSDLPLVLGGKADGERYFDGAIDELVILSRVMTPDEIAEQYRIGSPLSGNR